MSLVANVGEAHVKEPAFIRALMTAICTSAITDIISEDAFNQWEDSSDPAEQAGKGVAKTSVVQFFTWLHEAEEESQEDS
ncbi:hypothetical protein NP493_3464g00002 [Ridgeia piscesae]|uniref:W2 domain-containing protein n=1 Tax=Ridgeia piscesae TaxID=27915 RepID=A0AAD9J693_RIDPI|nr:hypothetical protein NP493_3464g00002 [Ridgeia piscesae]